MDVSPDFFILHGALDTIMMVKVLLTHKKDQFVWKQTPHFDFL